MPLACGRVCPHSCEASCRRNDLDCPFGHQLHVKRFVADCEYDFLPLLPAPDLPATGKRVAVIGGGPAGLTCAYFLGHGPRGDHLRQAAKLGGMLRYGIPEYRLPEAVLDKEIQGILDLGVRPAPGAVRQGLRPGELKAEGFDAIFLGLGAWKDTSCSARGGFSRVRSAMDFLSRLAGGETPIPPVTAVVGGGNTAIDCARTCSVPAPRKFYLVYRRTRKEMPAHPIEVEEAEAKGLR